MKSTGSNSQPFSYVGEELELFSHAIHWKRYWSRQIAPFIGADVLEVGAGTGTNTLLLASDRQRRWVCLEPDSRLAADLQDKVSGLKSRPASLEVVAGDLGALPPDGRFDTILYIDVLEHIEADREQLDAAYRRLSPNGCLVVLSPAHPFLFSDFDAGLGHFRRYTRESLRSVGPANCPALRIFYLDSMGFFASLANRFLLKQELPTLRQIQTWDRYLVTASKIVDPLLGFNFGKTVVGIWRRDTVATGI